MSVQQTLDEINTKLGVLVDAKKNTVTLSLEEYMKMKKVYEENKDKNYLIHLTVTDEIFVNEDGTRTQISYINTNNFNFPDDTETKLSEVFTRVYENTKWVNYLQAKLEEAKKKVLELTHHNEELSIENQELKSTKVNKWWRSK